VLAIGLTAGCGGDVANQEDPMDAVERASEALTVPTGDAYLPFSSSYAAGAVALTFDDGPDDTSTERVLDVLAQKGVKATFFVNTANWCDLANDAHCQAVLRRIYDEGHTVGNHTAHHLDLADPDTDAEDELASVERVLHDVVPGAPMITLARAPYGSPYISGPQSALNRVAPIVSRHGVHVGWSIDSGDTQGCTTSTCVKGRVSSALAAGRRGVVLLHSTYSWTVKALPAIIDDVRARGLRFVSVESLVRKKYGRSSYSLTKSAQTR
jgi:peptidoglycan/xylan/chitin deacetylase (PgdA/CDA1 family)